MISWKGGPAKYVKRRGDGIGLRGNERPEAPNQGVGGGTREARQGTNGSFAVQKTPKASYPEGKNNGGSTEMSV